MPSSEDLREAVRREDLELIRQLVQEHDGVDVNARFVPFNKPTLHIAVLRDTCNLEVVQLLLENGADVNARDMWGRTALDCVFSGKRDLRIAQLLLDYKVDINATAGRDDHSTLHLALRSGANLEAIQLLISYKANVRATSRYGRTALHYALEGSVGLDVVRLLVEEYKLDVNATDNYGSTPLHPSVNCRRVTTPIMKLMLAHHVDILAKNVNMATPLHALVGSDSVKALRAFFTHIRATNKGQDTIEAALLCAHNSEGSTPLHLVHSLDMAKLLLEQPPSENDPLGPRVCYRMPFVKNRRGESFLDMKRGGSLGDYIRSYTDLPLSVPGIATCEHRAKRQRHDNDDVGVRTNPMLNDFQRAIAETFLNKGWSTLFERDSSAEEQDSQDVLPIELKRATMGYLSLADIMQLL